MLKLEEVTQCFFLLNKYKQLELSKLIGESSLKKELTRQTQFTNEEHLSVSLEYPLK